MKKKIILSLTILWTAFIFYNSLQTVDESVRMSGFFADIAMWALKVTGLDAFDMETLSVIVRKAAHFTEFFVQSILMSMLAGNKKYRQAVIYVLFFGLLTACCDEFLQMFSEGRGSAVSDVFVDFSGTLCAVALISLKKNFEKKSLLN